MPNMPRAVAHPANEARGASRRLKVFADDLSTAMRFIARNPKNFWQLSHWTRPRAGGLPAEMSANGGKPLSVAAYLRGPTSEALLRIFDFDAALPLYSEGLRLLDNSISERQRKREVSSTEAPSRRTAGASGFLISSQSPERPAR
jgi:hypothetical protein